MKIAAYCRVSTEKEAQIDSLEKQIEFFNEFTKKNGYELYKLYADEGISGKQIKHRKQFQQMMQDAKAKKFERVVVKDVSRFARNTVDLLQSIRELKSYGIQVDKQWRSYGRWIRIYTNHFRCNGTARKCQYV